MLDLGYWYRMSFDRRSSCLSAYAALSFSYAFMTLSDLTGSGSDISSPMTAGTICQDTPYLSLSQPQERSDLLHMVSFRSRTGPGCQAATRTLNPPQTIRATSKGIAFGSHIFAMRGSFITFALTRSRCARDLYTM